MYVPARTVVIGVGNEYRRDDGVGPAVISVLGEGVRGRLPSGITLTVCDGDPARLISIWEHARRAIVVDAARVHPPYPGRLHRLALGDDPPLWPQPDTSSHGLGLAEAIELARALDRLPPQLVIYAVEPADTALGTGLSPPVAAAVAPLALRITNDLTPA